MIDLSKNIKIAIASGKGGTGKTFVSTNLFNALQHANIPATIVDCDAEEPNVHLFLHGTLQKTTNVFLNVPVIDESSCTHCGRCHEYCSYNAIFHVPSLKVISVMEELCHGCGACFVACRDNAIHAKQKSLGSVTQIMINDQCCFIEARTRIGVYSSVNVIKAAIAEAKSDQIVILDSPPGTSCPFIQTANLADFVVLVTEPTPFGLSDLKQSVETLSQMNKMLGVIINKSGIGNTDVYDYLKEKNIPLLMEIPFSRDIAKAYSTGVLITSTDEDQQRGFLELFEKIRQQLWKSQS